MAGNGIADLVGRKLTLEERIIECVGSVPTDADLKENYTDAEDRARVINRSRIAALLTAVFEHNSDDMAEEEEGADCLLYTSPSPRDTVRSRMPSSA